MLCPLKKKNTSNNYCYAALDHTEKWCNSFKDTFPLVLRTQKSTPS